MKNDRKATTPIIAAHSNKNKSVKPVPPARENKAGPKARVSRVSQEATERMKSIVLERIGDGIIGFDADMNHTYVNGRAGELLGRKPADLIGKNFWKEYPESIGTSFADACQRAFETQSITQFDGYFPPIDNWLQGSVHPSDDGLSVLFTDGARHQHAAIEHARTEANLRESEERLRLAAQAARMCTWELNIQEQTYKLGDNFAEVLGCSADLLPANSNDVSDMLNIAEDMHAIREAVIDAVKTRSEVPPLQYRVVNPETEEIIWLEVNAKLVYDHEGKPHRMLGMVQNITERRTVEELLRAKESELAAIINQTPFMLNRCSSDLRYRFVSRAYAEMIGRKSEEIEGRLIVEIIGEEGLKTITPHIENVLQGNRVEYETQVSFQGVEAPWLHVVYTPDRDAHGNVVGWFASIADITERKQAEENLRARAEENETLLEVSPIGIFVAHDPACKRISGNLAGYELVGLHHNLDANISKSAPPEESPAYWVFRNGKELQAEEMPMQVAARLGMEVEEESLELRFEDGSHKYIYAYAKPLFDKNGCTRGAIASILDITERKRAEIQISELNAELQSKIDEMNTLLEILPVGVWVGNHDCSVITGNTAAYRIMGLERGINASVTSLEPQLTGSLKILVNGEEVQPEDAPMQRVAHSGEPLFNLEHDFIHPNGTRRSVFTNIVPLLDRQGKVRKVIGAYTDFTERKQMEEELLASRQRLSATYEHAPIGMVEYSLEGRFIKVNEEFCRILGYEKEELLKLSMKDVTCEEDYPFDEILHRQLVMGEIPFYRIEKRYKRKDGSLIWAQKTRSAVHDSQGKVLYSIGAVVDITERKRVEEALRQSEERFARFMQHLPGLAWIKDIQGRYEYANAAAEKAFGIARENLYGRTDQDVFPPEVADQFKKNDERALMEEKGVQVIEELKHEDGVLHYSLVNKFPIPGPDGTPALIGGTAFNITERIQMEDALQVARDKAEETAYRIAQLQAVAAALSEALTPSQVAEVVVAQGAPALGAVSSSMILLTEDGQSLEIMYSSAQQTLIRPYMRFPISMRVPAADAARSGQIVWIESQQQYLERYPDLADQINLWGHQAAIAIPMIYKGRTLGVLTLSFDQIRSYTLEDQDFVLTLARQGAQALDRARTEHSLRESEERYRNLFNLVPIAVYSCDASGRIQEYNQRSVEMWGREPAKNSLNEKYCGSFKIFYPDGRSMPHEACPMARVLAGETLEQRELEILVERPDGSRRNVIAHPLALKNEHGEIVSAINCLYDITERKQMEDELLAGRQRLSATYEYAPIGIVEGSPDGRHIKVNEEFIRILGYEKDELLKLGIKDLTYEQDYPLEEARYRQLVMGAIPFYNIEKRYKRRDGTLIWVQITRSAVRNAQGKTLYTIGAVTDISDRKQAEQTLQRINLELEERVQNRTTQLQAANQFLRESEATSRLILESMPDAIVIMDGEGRIVHCNEQVESLFGYLPKDVLGQPVEMLIPKRLHDQHISHRHVYDGQRHRRVMGLGSELFGLRKDHSEFPVDVMLSPMSGNTTWDVLVTIRDNTEQKQAQDALRASEEKLRTLFEILPVGISFLDKDARITEMNSALAEILGVPKKDLLKGSFKSRRYIHPDGTPMPPTEFASTRAITEQKTIYNVETGIVKEKDEIIWTNVNAAPVDVAGVKAVVVTADISKRRQADEALRQNRERLRHLSRRLVEVQEEERRAIARELHDRVGQNLAALNLNLNILRSQISEQSLKQIGTRLDDSVNMVKEILTITRSVMNDLRSNVLDDYGLVSALSEYAEKFRQRYGIQVITEPQAQPIPRLDPGIEMTLLRIAQEALTNVARHAHASNVTLAINVENNAVNMTIQDNGSGILSWQKANQPGSHGLRIIRERAEAFGGLLHVYSSYQKGTRIEVKISLTSGNQNKVLREKRS